MGTANKARQAAFKARMRAAGKRQLTVWVDPAQEQAVRDLLAGEPIRYQKQGVDGARSERECLLAAREAGLEQRELQLQNHERQLERQLRPANAGAPGAAGMGQTARVNALIKAFTTDRNVVTGKVTPVSTPFMAKVQSDLVADLARKTTTVRNGLAALLQEFDRHGILADADASVLADARRATDEIGQAAAEARQIVARSAKKLEADEAQRKRDAFAAVRQRFGEIGVADSVLVSAQWPSLDTDFVLRVLRRLAPGDGQIREYARQLSEAAFATLAHQVADVMSNTGLPAQAALDGLVHELEGSKPELLRSHGDLIRHTNACLAADALTRTA